MGNHVLPPVTIYQLTGVLLRYIAVQGGCGVFHGPTDIIVGRHLAILYPSRKDLAIVLKRLIDARYPLTGASDHGVSEALYLNDPDSNGVELYWDRPKEKWPFDQSGGLQMVTEELDLDDLLSELND